VIYLGFLAVSRAAFGRKLESLYPSPAHRESALRITDSARRAVEQYIVLQTVKATVTALVAFTVLSLTGATDAAIVAFVVFLVVYIPLLGPAIGVVLPTLLVFAESGDLVRTAIVAAAMEVTVFLNGNVLMPKLQSDRLNVDPLLVLLSLGFWGLLFGAPGVVLSTPLTVTVMAVAAEFPATRWLAVLLSKDGQPGGETGRSR